jgi:hypothetical protein
VIPLKKPSFLSLSPLRHVLNVTLPVKPCANDRPQQEFIDRVEVQRNTAHQGGVHPAEDESTTIAAALSGR